MNTFQVAVCKRCSCPPSDHFHRCSFAQLVLPLSGTVLVESENLRLEINEFAVCFIPYECLHKVYADGANEILELNIPVHLVPKLGKSQRMRPFQTDLDTRWDAIRTLLMTNLDCQLVKSSSLLHLTNYIIELIITPCESYSLKYVHQHYHSLITVEQLSRMEGYSPSYYCEWFRKKTGTTPKLYIQELRLQKAKEMLQYTSLPIHQISQQLGYERASSFTRMFRQRLCIAPHKYREKNQILENKHLR